MELMIPLDSQDKRPLYEQIYHYIKEEIRTGGIRPARQLPSTRQLAESLKVSRSTTQLAYEQLVSEGYLEAIPRKGYFAASLEGIFRRLPRRLSAMGKSLRKPQGRRRRQNMPWIFHPAAST